MSNPADDYYDVPFTTRQLAILLGLRIIIVGGVFVGGILVGRNLAPPGLVAGAPAPLPEESPPEPAPTQSPTQSNDEPIIGAGTPPAPPPPGPVTSPVVANPESVTPSPPPASPGVGDFAIQVAAVRDQQSAENLQQALTAIGLEAYLEAAPRGLIRVRVGRFPSREAARETVELLQANGRQAIIVPR